MRKYKDTLEQLFEAYALKEVTQEEVMLEAFHTLQQMSKRRSFAEVGELTGWLADRVGEMVMKG